MFHAPPVRGTRLFHRTNAIITSVRATAFTLSAIVQFVLPMLFTHQYSKAVHARAAALQQGQLQDQH